MANTFTKSDVEILLSTMNRSSLDFLLPMFPFSHFSEFNIVIVNQTTEKKILISEYPTVNVINSFERGLSRSRNLLLNSASKKIGLIADDDLVFVEGFDESIVKGFNHFPEAAIIKFIATTFEGEPFRKYPQVPVAKLSTMLRLNSSSIEMALNMELVRRSGVRFSTDFGLGSDFPLGEEPVFVSDIHTSGYRISHYPEVIVTHKAIKDSDQISLEVNCKTRGAYLTRVFKRQSLFWIAVQIFFFVKHGTVKPRQIIKSLKWALQGRSAALRMTNTQL